MIGSGLKEATERPVWIITLWSPTGSTMSEDSSKRVAAVMVSTLYVFGGKAKLGETPTICSIIVSGGKDDVGFDGHDCFVQQP